MNKRDDIIIEIDNLIEKYKDIMRDRKVIDFGQMALASVCVDLENLKKKLSKVGRVD